MTRFRHSTFASIISFLSVPALAGTCIQIDSDHVMSSGASAPVRCESSNIAIGSGGGAVAKGLGIAIGDKANASGLYSPIALGTKASALGEFSVAVGCQTKVTDKGYAGIALGPLSVANSGYSTVIGIGATVEGGGSLRRGDLYVTDADR